MPESSRPSAVKFHYIKGNFFRVSHADGAIGNITPAGLIFVGFYSERVAIPQMMVHELSEEGQIGLERQEERVTKEGVVRELDAGVVMGVPTAKYLVKWLEQQIENAEKLKEQSTPDPNTQVN